MKKRIINYRPIFFAAVFQILSLLFGCYLSKFWYFGLIILLAFSALLVFKKKYFTAGIIAVLSFAGFFFARPLAEADKLLKTEDVFITVRVGSGISFYGDSVEFTADRADVTREDGTKLKLKTMTAAAKFSEDGEAFRSISAGWRVEMTGVMQTYRLKSGGTEYRLIQGKLAAPYYGRPSALSGIRYNTYKNLTKNMSEENAGLCYAMLFGDKGALTGNVYDDFRFSGLAHVLAVSGLHVNLILAVFMYVLRRMRVPKNYALLSALPILCFYCALCGFSAGVFRASLMFCVYAAASLLHKRYDPLGALSLASITALLIFPDKLFGYSYPLSYLAAFSIFAVMPRLMKLTEKPLSRVPLRIRQALCLTVSAQIMTLPVTLNFGFNPYAVLTNIVVLPVIIAHFYILIPAAVLSIIPFMSFILTLPGLTASAALALTNFAARLPAAHITLIPAVLLFLLVPALFIAGKFVMLNIKWKAASALPLCLAAVIALSAANAPPPKDYSATLFSQGIYNETLIIDGKTRVYAGKIDKYGDALRDGFLSRRIRKLDAVFLTSAADGPYLKMFVDKYKPKTVFIPEHLYESCFDTINNAFTHNSQMKVAEPEIEYAVAGNIVISYVYDGGRIVFLTVSAENKGIVFAYTASVALLEANALKLSPRIDFYVTRGGLVPDGVGLIHDVPDYMEYFNGGREPFRYVFG